jgi:hypothetical protein
MKQQIDTLETDRKRRHDSHMSLEEKITKLEEENELKREEIARLQVGLMMNQNQKEQRGDFESHCKSSRNHPSMQSSSSECSDDSSYVTWDVNSQGAPFLASFISREEEDVTASSTTTTSQSDTQGCE